ncbi:hypothetical protein [Corynebacterium sp.]|uniref:hypothetical protein n=1 Tax=Corynebacterium sp. TaxID=1720 RepID=UPI0025BA7B83|nr:hypothetical protein [Corynebacterium sp.]
MKNHGLQATALVAGVGVAWVLGACTGATGDGGRDDPVVTVTATATRSVEVTVPPGPPAETESPDDTGGITVPGEEVETYFSTEGQEVGVAGLRPDREPIVVRDVPSAGGRPVAEVDRLGAVELAGREWNNTDDPDEGYWAEVRVDGHRGWMPSGNLFHFGGTTDVTDDYRDLPTAATDDELLEAVGEEATGGMADWIILTTPDYAGEPFYRLDVTGMKDDAQAGERLFVTVVQADGGHRVGKVERTLVCHRGVSGGLCL